MGATQSTTNNTAPKPQHISYNASPSYRIPGHSNVFNSSPNSNLKNNKKSLSLNTNTTNSVSSNLTKPDSYFPVNSPKFAKGGAYTRNSKRSKKQNRSRKH